MNNFFKIFLFSAVVLQVQASNESANNNQQTKITHTRVIFEHGIGIETEVQILPEFPRQFMHYISFFKGDECVQSIYHEMVNDKPEIFTEQSPTEHLALLKSQNESYPGDSKDKVTENLKG